MLTLKDLDSLRAFFEQRLQWLYKYQIAQEDSDKLLDNHITGFLIALQDQIRKIKPDLNEPCNCDRRGAGTELT